MTSAYRLEIDRQAHAARLRAELEGYRQSGPSLPGERRHSRLDIQVDVRGAYRVRQPGSSRWLCID